MVRTALHAIAAIGGLLLTPPALAQADQPSMVAAPFGAATAVEPEQLGAIAGQADLQQVVTAQNKAEVSRNSVSGNSVTGTIGLGSSFENMNGLSVLNANTGNNVAINSSLNVNVAIYN